MMFSPVASVAIIAGLPRPVYLVLVASALAYFVAPVIFFLNLYYCLTVISKEDKMFYPSVFAKWFGWLSFVVFTGMSLILILGRVFKISLFG
jgi:Mn2+/Fe2+ NRAMP family transporter